MEGCSLQLFSEVHDGSSVLENVGEALGSTILSQLHQASADLTVDPRSFRGPELILEVLDDLVLL